MSWNPPPGLGPEEIAHLAQRAKNVLRERMKRLRVASPKPVLAQKSLAIVERLNALPVIAQATGVGLYWPIAGRGEVDLRELDRGLRARGKRLYYPFLRRPMLTPPSHAPAERDRSEGGPVSFETGFALVEDRACFEGQSGLFPQPPESVAPAKRGELEVIVVPALAAAPDLGRIGYGAGYYDATLPDYCPPAVVIAAVFDFQLVAEIPAEAHDFSCDAVVTELRWFARDQDADHRR